MMFKNYLNFSFFYSISLSEAFASRFLSFIPFLARKADEPAEYFDQGLGISSSF